jgi:hypothetical protein
MPASLSQNPSVPKTNNNGNPAEKPKKNIRSVIFWVYALKISAKDCFVSGVELDIL